MRDRRVKQILVLLLLLFLYRAIFESPPSPSPPISDPGGERIQGHVAMDTFFISHGSPTLSIDDSLPARHFLLSWQQKVFPRSPTAILVVSAHWETAEPTINVIQGRHSTIYDFYGFPDQMYKARDRPFLSLDFHPLLVFFHDNYIHCM